VLRTGEVAPDFELVNTKLERTKLSDFKGKNVVLVFYPGAFTSVCEKELCTFRDSITKFNRFEAVVLGVSVDSPFANRAFAEKNRINFELLSDFGAKVAKLYGGVHEDFLGVPGYVVCKRAVYVIDRDGRVVYGWVSEDPRREPDYGEIEDVLKNLA